MTPTVERRRPTRRIEAVLSAVATVVVGLASTSTVLGEEAVVCIDPAVRATIVACPAGSPPPVDAAKIRGWSGSGLRGHRRMRQGGEESQAPPSLWGDLSCDAARAEAARSSLENSERSCLVRTRVVSCAVRNGRPSEHLVERVRETVEQMRVFVAGDHSAEAERRCRAATARVVVDEATRWHREAVGTDVHPGTLNEETMELALRAYRLALASFADLDELGVTGWSADRAPTVPRVTYWMAELLWAMNRWTECGASFNRAWELDRGADFANEALYAAVLCTNNHFTEREGTSERWLERQGPPPGRELRLRRRDFLPQERQVADTFHRYICAFPDAEEWSLIAYRRARVYYEANQWAEAATLFEEVVRRSTGDELAPFAATLALDSLNALGMVDESRRPACRAAIASRVERWVEDENLRRDPAFVERMTSLRCSFQLSRARELSEEERFDEALVILRGLATNVGGNCARVDGEDFGQALHRAAAGLVERGRAGDALRLWRRLFQLQGSRREDDEESPIPSWVAPAMLAAAQARQILCMFTVAAEEFESVARRFPASHEAVVALEEAARLRIALGNFDAAALAVESFEAHARRDRQLAARSAALTRALAEAESAEHAPEVDPNVQRLQRTSLRQNLFDDEIRAWPTYLISPLALPRLVTSLPREPLPSP